MAAQPQSYSALISAACAPHAATCSIVVHGNLPISAELNLAEVALYDLAGARIPRSRITAATSSTYAWVNVDTSAASVLDGRNSSIVHTYSASSGDWDPTLRIMYPCPQGMTSLSNVVVVNREGCCQDRIVGYRMDFLNAAGRQDRDSYMFTQAQASYNIVLGECVVAGWQGFSC